MVSNEQPDREELPSRIIQQAQRLDGSLEADEYSIIQSLAGADDPVLAEGLRRLAATRQAVQGLLETIQQSDLPTSRNQPL